SGLAWGGPAQRPAKNRLRLGVSCALSLRRPMVAPAQPACLAKVAGAADAQRRHRCAVAQAREVATDAVDQLLRGEFDVLVLDRLDAVSIVEREIDRANRAGRLRLLRHQR